MPGHGSPARPITVRRASFRDAATISEILRLAFEPLQARYTPAAYNATVVTAVAAEERMRNGPIWLAELEGAAVGTFAAATDDRGCYLRGMGVAPQARGAGAGRALLDAALDHAAEIAAPLAWLHTTPFLHEARRLYERAGFEVEHDGPPADLHGTPLLAMAKRLR